MPSRRTPLADADRSALRDEVVAALRRGELCALPTETVYGVAAMPSAPGAEERLRRWRGDEDRRPPTLHVSLGNHFTGFLQRSESVELSAGVEMS